MITMTPTPNDATDDDPRSAGCDPQRWGRLLERHRDRLRRMVVLRLDMRLQGRVDPSDVIQEALLEATRRREEYGRDREHMPFYLWLRFLVGQKILEQHRRHLGAQSRDIGREVSLYRGPMPEATSAAIAAQLIGRHSSPSQAAIRAERKLRLQEALNRMDSIDREILVLRHYEQLSNGEVALVLGLDKSAASKRYARALVRLKDVLSAMPGGLQEP
jgi:RNA polymerase sigma-70 factor (ECF subfamily)